MTKYVLKYINPNDVIDRKYGEYVNIDSNSGGYPVNYPLHLAKFFETVEKAKDYAKHFPGRFAVEQVTFDTSPVEY